MERKTALIGCREGSWIRTSGMNPLRLNARVQSDTMLQVEQQNHRNEDLDRKQFVGPGKHVIPNACWTRVRVADGAHIDALCMLEGG
jgi:hypothetical protein